MIHMLLYMRLSYGPFISFFPFASFLADSYGQKNSDDDMYEDTSDAVETEGEEDIYTYM